MTRFTLLFLLAVAILALALFIVGQIGWLRGHAPKDLGLTDGKLKRPSKTENSVSSQADLWPDHPMRSYAQIAPLSFAGDADDAMRKLNSIVASLPRTVVLSSEHNYLYAQCSTSLLKFTDDVEFALDKTTGLIHVRSASRLGRKDFGVNRARIETIRSEFAK